MRKYEVQHNKVKFYYDVPQIIILVLTRNSSIFSISRPCGKLSYIWRPHAIHFEFRMLNHFVTFKLAFKDSSVFESNHALMISLTVNL